MPVPASPTPAAPDPGLLGPVAHGPGFAQGAAAAALRTQGYRLAAVSSPAELPVDTLALLLDSGLAAEHPLPAWRAACPTALLLVAGEGEAGADLVLPAGFPEAALLPALSLAVERRHLRQLNEAMGRNLAQSHLRLNQLTEVGTALSAETDIHRLLDRLLADGRRIACCDAASLFLIDEREDGSRELVFKLTQNASITFPFSEHRFPLDATSLAGHVALHGDELNITDVYRLPEDVPYRFHRGIDEVMGYRSVSMLLLPMRSPQGQIIGVLEFINRKDRPERLLRGREAAEQHTLPFGESETTALRALAGLAATAIANNLLMSAMGALFDGFVAAAVTALEERSQAVGEHGYRVGERVVRMAEALLTNLDERALRELRYACLLHDFGHAGPHPPGGNGRLAAFRKRLGQERERLKQRQFEALLAGQRALLLPDVLARIDGFLQAVEKADVPAVRPEALFREPKGELFPAAATLDEEDRQALAEHLRRTLACLARLDWHPALAARGSGLAEGERLPLGARLVVLGDVYDMLTRREGEAGLGLSAEDALDLLRDECANAPGWLALVDALSRSLA